MVKNGMMVEEGKNKSRKKGRKVKEGKMDGKKRNGGRGREE